MTSWDYSKFDKIVKDFEEEERKDAVKALPKLNYANPQDRERMKYLYPNITVTRKADYEKQQKELEEKKKQQKEDEKNNSKE